MKTARTIKAETHSGKMELNDKAYIPASKSNGQHTEKKLRQSSDSLSDIQFANVIENINEGFLALDAQMNYTYINQRGGELLKRKPEDLIGKNHWEEYPDDKDTSFGQAYLRALETGSPVTLEDYYAPLGRWFENRIYPSDNGLLIFFTDISERKQSKERLRESQERFRALVSQATAGISQSDVNGRLTFANPKFCEMLGYTESELIGKTIWELTYAEDLEENKRLFNHMITRGESYQFEKRFICRDGSLLWTNVSVSAIRDMAGQPKAGVAVIVDVNARRRQEEELKKLNHQIKRQAADFDITLSAITDYVYTFDRDGRFLYANQSLLDLWGLVKEDALGKTMAQLNYPKQVETQLLAGVRQVFATGQRVKNETFYTSPTGTSAYYENILHPVFGDNGSVESVTGSSRDITEHKRAQLALTEFARQQEALYKLTDQLQRTNSPEDVFDAALDAILGALQCDRASILLFDDTDVMRFVAWRGLSEDYRKATDGHSPWKHDEKNPQPICVNDIGAAEISDSLKSVIKEEGIGSLAFIPLVSNGKLIGKFMTYFNAPHVFSDSELELSLTIAHQLAFGIDRKRTEEKLRASEALYRAIAGGIPGGGVYVVDKDMRYLVAEGSVTKAFGLSRDVLEGRTVSEIFSGEIRDNLEKRFRQAFAGEIVSSEVERDGRVYWSQSAPLVDSIGEAIIVTLDVTERKRAEALLRESESRFREMIDALPAAIYTTDAEGRLTHFNPAAAEFSGRVPELGTDQWCVSWKLYHPDGTPLPHDQCPMAIALKEGRAVRGAQAIAERPDGTRIWFEPYPTPLRDSTGRIVGGINMLVDITERKQAEEALQQLNLQLESRVQERTVELQAVNQSLRDEIAERQKVEGALHESRRGLQILSQRLVEVQEEERRAIANELHDRVGQSLSALNINLTIMRDQIAADSLQRIGSRLNDSMKLTAEAITLVRDVMSDLRPAVLDDYGLEAALQSYMDQFKSRYGIKILFEKPDQPIQRLGSSIEMTFLRIAQEALLNIARHARADQVSLSLWQEEKAIRLIVQDNGTGIESWQEANRPGSHGLTIMRERADAVGGNLSVISVPGKGTKVEVSIPHKIAGEGQG